MTGCHALDHRERDCKPRWLLFDVFTLGDSQMSKIETGMRWDNIMSALESEPWEPQGSYCGDGEVRMVFIGSLINPSGKYYLPFACSNLNPCPNCGGGGKVKPKAKRRLINKLKNAQRHSWLRYRKALTKNQPVELLKANQYAIDAGQRLVAMDDHCPRCGGCGSHEAHDDEVFWEMLEKEAEEHGCYVQSGEGDPTDTFIGQYRDTPDEDDQDEDDDN